MKSKAFFTIVAILTAGIGFGQCTNQILNLSGTSVVNGVEVSVTSTGIVDSNTDYCASTFPYFVGYNNFAGSGNGTFKFNFSPAVNSITLNFSGISNVGDDKEIVALSVNGVHYPIPSIGTNNVCDALAVLTTNGDITGCDNCPVSGWNGTTIAGPITSLTVLDSAISGIGNGALFSLFICESAVSNVQKINNKNKHKTFPNPFTEQTTLQIDYLLKDATLSICNYLGQKVKEIKNISGQTTTIFRDNLPKGLYLFNLAEGQQLIATGKLVIID